MGVIISHFFKKTDIAIGSLCFGSKNNEVSGNSHTCLESINIYILNAWASRGDPSSVLCNGDISEALAQVLNSF